MTQQILPISMVQQMYHVCSSKVFIFIRFIFSLFFIILVAISCTGIDVRRVFYRFNYSSVDNTISTVEVYVLEQSLSGTSFYPRITIEWNDIAANLALNTTISSINSSYSII